MNLKVSKGIIAGFLGGGVLLATVLGGIKIKETIEFNNNVRRYSKVSQKLEGLKHLLNQGTLLKYGDTAGWRRKHNQLKSRTGDNLVSYDFPTAESFRDYCYSEIEKKIESESDEEDDTYIKCAEEEEED